MSCEDCRHYKENLATAVKFPEISGTGKASSPLMVVFDYPSVVDQQRGVSRARVLYESLAKQAGFTGDIYFTYAVKCWTFTNEISARIERTPTKAEVIACRNHLIEEIQKIKPVAIIAPGSLAASSLIKSRSSAITRIRTETFDLEHLDSSLAGITVFPTFGAELALEKMESHQHIIYDFQRASNYIKTGDLSVIKQQNYITTTDPDIAIAELKKISGQDIVAWDIETAGKWDSIDPCYPGSIITTMAFSTKEGTGLCFPIKHKDCDLSNHSGLLREIRRVLEDPNIPIIGHNLKFDTKWVKHVMGITVSGVKADTQLMWYLLEEERSRIGSTSLKNLAKELTDLGDYDADITFDQEEDGYVGSYALELDKLLLYNAIDVDATLRIYNIGLPKTDPKVLDFTEKFILPGIEVLVELELNGINACRKTLKRSKNTIKIKLDLRANDLAKLMPDINLNSPKQLREFFFVGLGLKSTVKTPKGLASTSSKALEELLKTSLSIKSKACITTLLAYRKENKLWTTYLRDFDKYINPKDGRVHADFWMTTTETGRLSSRKPNLQNIANQQEVLEVFTAPAGKTLLVADYSQQELRILACLSKDKTLIDAYKNGKDIHAMVARRAFKELKGLSLADIKQNHNDKRQIAKMINFGSIYGMTVYGLSFNLGISLSEAKKFMQAYFDTFPGIQKWMGEVRLEASQNPIIFSPLGRRRYLPNATKGDKHALRQALNSPIQSAGSDITLKSGYRIMKKLPDAKLINLVHDSVMLEIPEGKVDEYAKIMEQEMTDQTEYPWAIVPFEIEVKAGKSWASLKQI